MSSNEYMAKYINYRYLKLKLQAVEYKGGKCEKCGYNKYFNLSFHHRDPTEKDYDWKYLRKQSWVTICKELDKCMILCHNCHGERHYDSNELEQMQLFFNTRKKKNPITYAVCPCGTRFKVTHDRKRFCCVECRVKWEDSRKFKIPNTIVEDLKTKSLDKIAGEVGISRKNLIRRLVKEGLYVVGCRSI